MIKQFAIIVLIASLIYAQNACSANISGPNNATPGRRAVRASASCSANISGPNNASPAKRQSVVCSGNGVCDGDTCVCNAGYEGDECQTPCIESTTAAPTAAPTEAPSTAAPTPAPTTEAPTAAPTPAPTTEAPTAAPTVAPTTEAPPVQQTPAPTSASCAGANISGPNNASPARFLRQAAVCSGNGVCNGQVCQCNPGYSGSECEIAPTTAAPTSASCAGANISGPNNASPAKRLAHLLRQATVCSGNGVCNGQVCQCNAGYSGSECEIPPVQQTPAPTSASCSGANISGPNNASPAKRQNAVCSGNGECNSAQVCVCTNGYTGSECEIPPVNAPGSTAAPSTAAPSAAPSSAAPSTAPTTAAPSSAAPSAGPTTASPTSQISGENNARTSDSSTKVVSIGTFVIAAVAAVVLM